MSPTPKEIDRCFVYQEHSREELINLLEGWSERLQKGALARAEPVGFILDNDCAHPVFRHGGRFYVLGGRNFEDPYLTEYFSDEEGRPVLNVNWGGEAGKRTYPIFYEGVFLGEKEGGLVLWQEGYGEAVTRGMVMFPEKQEGKELGWQLKWLLADERCPILMACLRKAAGMIE